MPSFVMGAKMPGLSTVLPPRPAPAAMPGNTGIVPPNMAGQNPINPDGGVVPAGTRTMDDMSSAPMGVQNRIEGTYDPSRTVPFGGVAPAQALMQALGGSQNAAKTLGGMANALRPQPTFDREGYKNANAGVRDDFKDAVHDWRQGGMVGDHPEKADVNRADFVSAPSVPSPLAAIAAPAIDRVPGLVPVFGGSSTANLTPNQPDPSIAAAIAPTPTAAPAPNPASSGPAMGAAPPSMDPSKTRGRYR